MIAEPPRFLPHRPAKEPRRQALIEAATAVFAERGFAGATTREIAERSGCAEGLIHRYFGGKQGLLLAVCQNRALAAMEDLTTLPPRPDVRSEIQDILLAMAEAMRRHSDFMRVSVSQAVIDPTFGHRLSDGFHQQRVEIVRRRLEAHREGGRIRPDADLEAVAQVVVGLGFTFGFLGQIVFQRGEEELRRLVAEAAEVVAQGIAPLLRKGRPSKA